MQGAVKIKKCVDKKSIIEQKRRVARYSIGFVIMGKMYNVCGSRI